VIAAFASGVAVAVALAALAWLVVRARIISSRIHDRVIVTLKTGESFSGVLFANDRKALVLRETAALGAGERSTNLPLDGEIIVLLSDVAYIQRP
jgi:small nuclear ribonucleoprotein (snRNP)-like protein